MDIKPNMPFYFFTRMKSLPPRENLEESNMAMERESIYRDLLQVSDVVGKKQNYFYDDRTHRLCYFDLGCSFVDAHEGSIEIKTHHPVPLDKKRLKQTLKRFERYSIRTINGNMLNMREFIESPYSLSLPTYNPETYMPLQKLITDYEIHEIVSRLASGLIKQKFLKRNGNSPEIVHN
jgi:hypothetical protein